MYLALNGHRGIRCSARLQSAENKILQQFFPIPLIIDEEFSSCVSLITHEILTEDLVKKLIEFRHRVGKITKADMIAELSLLIKCHSAMPDINDESCGAKAMFTFVTQRIFTLFQFIHNNHISIEKQLLLDFFQILQNSVKYLNDSNFKLLIDLLSNYESNKEDWTMLVNLFTSKRKYLHLVYFISGATKSLSPLTSLSVWDQVIHFLQIHFPSMLRTAFIMALHIFNKNEAQEIGCQYLKWYAGRTSNISFIRQVFREIQLKLPSNRLYELMITIEKNIENPNPQFIRELYEEASQQLFSHNDIHFWVNFIRFEFLNNNLSAARQLITRSMLSVSQNLRDELSKLIDTI